MNKFLLAASFLAALTTAIHTCVGGDDVATVALGLSTAAFFVGVMPWYVSGSLLL